MTSPKPTTFAMRAVRVAAKPAHSRALENVGFLLGLGLVVGFELFADILPRAHGSTVDHAFPWGLVVAAALLVAPKMLGRATAGRVWDALSKRT